MGENFQKSPHGGRWSLPVCTPYVWEHQTDHERDQVRLRVAGAGGGQGGRSPLRSGRAMMMYEIEETQTQIELKMGRKTEE